MQTVTAIMQPNTSILKARTKVAEGLSLEGELVVRSLRPEAPLARAIVAALYARSRINSFTCFRDRAFSHYGTRPYWH